eukprot:s1662_g1.t2
MVGGILFHAESCGEMKLYTGHICGDGATAFLISGLLSIVTMVFWSGVVRLAFSAETPFGKEAETDWLEIAGSNSRAAYRFLVYVLVVLISLRLKGIKAQHHSRTVSGWVRPFVLPPERVFLWPALFRASPSARFVAVILFSPRPSWSRLRFGRCARLPSLRQRLRLGARVARVRRARCGHDPVWRGPTVAQHGLSNLICDLGFFLVRHGITKPWSARAGSADRRGAGVCGAGGSRSEEAGGVETATLLEKKVANRAIVETSKAGHLRAQGGGQRLEE